MKSGINLGGQCGKNQGNRMKLLALATAALFALVSGKQETSWKELSSLGQTILISRIRDLESLTTTRESLVRIQLSDDDDLESLVSQFLDKIGQVFAANDPFACSAASVADKGYGVILEISGKELIISGFSSFAYNNLTVVEGERLQFGANFTFSGLQVTGSYGVNSNILSMFPIYGNGTFGAKLGELGIHFSSYLKQTNATKVLQITEAQFGFTVTSVKVDLENLYYREGLSELITNIINDVASGTFTTGTEGIALINSLLKAELNSLLTKNQITLQTIITFIKSFIQ